VVVFMRENAQTSAFSIRAVIYAQTGYMTGIQFSRSIPFELLTHCIADARFVSARDVIHDTIEEFNMDSKARPSSRPICDVAARTRQLLSIYSSIVSQMSING